MARGGGTPRRTGHLTEVAVEFFRHSSIYTLGSGLALFLSLVNAVVLTHYLAPGEFGRLALLLLLAALLTILYGLPFLPGTLARAYGAAGEDDVDDENVQHGFAEDRRAIMGTGLAVTAALGMAGTLVCVALAGPLASLLGLDAGDARTLIGIAAGSGALGALWRLVSNVLRLERRPVAYVLLNALRPLLAIAAVFPLVASGGGVEGAITATAVATAGAVLVGLVVVRQSYRLAFRTAELGGIAQKSGLFVPVVVGFWLVMNADLFIVAQFVDSDSLGHYRLAARLGSGVSYVSSAIFMAWAPLQQSATLKAADAERGRQVVRAHLVLYFVFVMAGMLLGLLLLSDVLLRLAPPSYEPAAQLLPVLGGVVIAHGLVVLIYRASSFRRRAKVYRKLVVIAGVAFLPLCAALSAAYGTYGAATAGIVTLLALAAIVWHRSQTGRAPIPLAYGRMASATALAGACFALGQLAALAVPALVAEVVALLAYPLGLLALRIVPAEHAAPLRRLALTLTPGSLRRELRRHVRELDRDEREALVTALSGGTDSDRLRDGVAALRRLAGVGGGADADQELAVYLFGGLPFFEREALASRLVSNGTEEATIAKLEEWTARLRRHRAVLRQPR